MSRHDTENKRTEIAIFIYVVNFIILGVFLQTPGEMVAAFLLNEMKTLLRYDKIKGNEQGEEG